MEINWRRKQGKTLGPGSESADCDDENDGGNRRCRDGTQKISAGAMVGIYGVTSDLLAGRTREIGIRIALGTRPSAVVYSVLKQGLQPLAIGLLVGLIGAVAGAAIRATLFGMSTLAPIVFFAVPVLLGTAATLACYVPARRAGPVDPAVTLRWE